MRRNTTPIVLSPQDQSRFWSMVDQSGGPDACWPWMYRTDDQGYGTCYFNGQNLRSARVALTLARGPIPSGLFACHHCDTPPCCNPSHLFAGSAADNYWDSRRKGRAVLDGATMARRYPDRLSRGDSHYARTHPERLARGERHGSAKLSSEDVVAILVDGRVLGMPQRVIADKYGVSESAIGKILSGKQWRHISDCSDDDLAARLRAAAGDAHA